MDAPTIARDPASIDRVGLFQTLVPGAEKGMFYCEGGGRLGDPGVPLGQDYGGTLPPGKCGKDLSSAATRILNNGQDYVARCGRCKRLLFFNAGWLSAKVIAAQQLKKNGHAPAVGRTFDDVKETAPAGTVREEPLPDGRKRIIVTPMPAVLTARMVNGAAVVR